MLFVLSSSKSQVCFNKLKCLARNHCFELGKQKRWEFLLVSVTCFSYFESWACKSCIYTALWQLRFITSNTYYHILLVQRIAAWFFYNYILCEYFRHSTAVFSLRSISNDENASVASIHLQNASGKDKQIVNKSLKKYYLYSNSLKHLTLSFRLNSSKWKALYWVECYANCYVYFNRLLRLTNFCKIAFNVDYFSNIQLEIF